MVNISNSKLTHYCLLLLFSALLASCATHEQYIAAQKKHVDVSLPSLEMLDLAPEKFNIETPASLTTLTPRQRQEFLTYMASPDLQTVPKHRRLFDYLDNKVGGFDYRGDTYSASVALDKNAGNCLSLALLTTALAKAAGVEIGYQKINTTPVYKKQSDVLLLSYHVRAFLFDPDYQARDDVMVFRRPRLIVDYFPDRGDIGASAISERQFLAMYYRNIASDNILKNELDLAAAYAQKALELAPANAENVNLMAVILKRRGNIAQAIQWYEHGLSHTESNINLLSNYKVLLEQRGETDKAHVLAQKLLELNDPNPYAWIKAGHEAFQQEQYHVAMRYFQKAIDDAPYLDDAYFGLAKSHFARNEFRQAAEAMEIAAEKAFEESERSLYYAKLATLRSMPHQPQRN
ncbi:MAG: tetratricopeptide repeat protein [Aestuariibacter sp.]